MAAKKTTPDCGPQFIYETMVNAQMSSIQAIGALANAMAESSLNPEAKVLDTNGYWSYGLWQFNTDTYPDAAGLVTGNCQFDIVQQVGYLQTHIAGSALEGATAEQVAGNFASGFENCQTCQPGGTSYAQRVANAATVSGWVATGGWPDTGAQAAAQSSKSGGASSTGSCLWTWPSIDLGITSVGGGCVLTKSEGRAFIGGLLLVAGGLLALPGVLLLAAFAFRGSGAAGGTGPAAAGAGSRPAPAGRAAAGAGKEVPGVVMAAR